MKLLSSSILSHPFGLQYRLSKITSCNIGKYSSVTTTLWLGKRLSWKSRCLCEIRPLLGCFWCWLCLISDLLSINTVDYFCSSPPCPEDPLSLSTNRPLLPYWWQLTDHPFIKIWKCSFALARIQNTSITCYQILIGLLDLRD